MPLVKRLMERNKVVAMKNDVNLDVGQVWKDEMGEVRIMAVAEGYVMARRKGCAPFLENIVGFRKRFPERVK